MKQSYLEIRNLNKDYTSDGFGPRRSPHRRRAVKNVSFDIFQGECFGLIGESGSGKTTLGRCLLRLISADDGRVLYGGVDLLQLPEKAFRPYRSRFQMIFQNPTESLNPRQRVGACLKEALNAAAGCPARKIPARVEELLAEVKLDADVSTRFPNELSGGQRQRIAIARALACEPEFIVADEPSSSLDAHLKREIIDLLMNLKRRFGLTLLLISHDLPLVAHVADRIGVMYRGKLIEVADKNTLLHNPAENYTKMLLRAFNQENDFMERVA